MKKITIRLDDTLYQEFCQVASYNGYSLNQQAVRLITRLIRAYHQKRDQKGFL